MNTSEALARCVIESLIPGSEMHFNPRQDRGQHDFWLEYPDGTRVPVEVTMSTDPRYRETAAAIRDRGHFIAAVRCRNSWMVHPAEDARITRLEEDLDTYLAAIEAAGLKGFMSATEAATYPAVNSIWRDLRVEAGSVFAWKLPRQIGIMLPTQSAEEDLLAVTRAVEAEAWKDDNRRKFGNAAAQESHFFVHVEMHCYPAWLGMVDGEPPCLAPRLPPEVSVLWAAARTRGSDDYIVWRASPRWEDMGTVRVPTKRIRFLLRNHRWEKAPPERE